MNHHHYTLRDDHINEKERHLNGHEAVRIAISKLFNY